MSRVFGANATVPEGGAGNLTMREGSRFIVDVSALPRKQYAEITLGGPVSLREGGTLGDYVALSDVGHTLSFSADGTKILVNDNVPGRTTIRSRSTLMGRRSSLTSIRWTSTSSSAM